MVAESGIASRAQGAAAELAGADAILVGSTLMRAPDPAAKLAELISRPLVKVCGLTREEDVAAAVEAGADLAGFILAKESPRRAAEVLPVPETVLSVAVYVGEPGTLPADLVQLYDARTDHRGRTPSSCAAARRSRESSTSPGEDRIRATSSGRGSRGQPDARRRARAGERPRAIDAVHPWAVDASSSLETAPGIKDHERVRAYVAAAR